jgi:pyruvate/2-oxoglutarate dehydrogenase complex dihydrolipoamide acyltransferase (E2) component
MTKLNENQSARIAALEKALAAAQKAAELAAAAAPTQVAQPESASVALASTSTLGKSDLKDLKALREEVTSLRKGVKEKDQKSKLSIPHRLQLVLQLMYSHST